MLRFRLLGIVALALALRIGFAWVYVNSHPARALATIPFLFEPGNIAVSLASGHGFSSPFRVDTGPTAWMTPVYPLLLSGVIRIFGEYTFQSFLAAAGLNIFFSTLTTIPIFFAARRIGGLTVATVSALLWAVFPNAILLPYESLWDASLSALLAATLLWATLAVAESKTMRNWCMYGLLWGAALMTNAALISLAPFLLGWLLNYSRRRTALAAAAAVLCCVPWTVRNYVVFHAFVPLRSVNGLALWLGNNDHAQTLTPGNLHPISNQTEREKYIAEGEIEYMREKQSEAIHWMVTHPGAEAGLVAERFVAIWSGGSAHLVEDFARARSARFFIVVLSNLLVAAGTVAGLVVLGRKRHPCFLPLLAFPAIFPLIYYFALAPPRYRHPADPALLLLTAVAVTHLANYKRRPVSPVSKGRRTVT